MSLPPANTVLYADDSADDRFLFQQAFAAAGLPDRLFAVDDGAFAVEALEAAEQAPPGSRTPALVVLDWKMPRKSGLETLQWIRASCHWRCMPVLILSASIAPADIESAYESGANAYLVKPSSAAELIEIARAVAAFWVRHAEYPRCSAGPA